jgi:hypothetical protein
MLPSFFTLYFSPSHHILLAFLHVLSAFTPNPVNLYMKSCQLSHHILPTSNQTLAAATKSCQLSQHFQGVSLQTNFCQSSLLFVSAFIPSPATLQNTSCLLHTKSFQPQSHDFLSVFKTCSVSFEQGLLLIFTTLSGSLPSQHFPSLFTTFFDSP